MGMSDTAFGDAVLKYAEYDDVHRRANGPEDARIVARDHTATSATFYIFYNDWGKHRKLWSRRQFVVPLTVSDLRCVACKRRSGGAGGGLDAVDGAVADGADHCRPWDAVRDDNSSSEGI